MKIRIYAADVKILEDRDLLNEAISRLDDGRKEKALRIKNEEGQRLSVGAGLLLKYTLAESGIIRDNAPVKIEYRENGKPYLAGRDDIFFNLSHSGDMVICAVGPCEVGCDIEMVREGKQKIAGRYFTEEEQAFASLSDRNFFHMWTLKESFLKVTGKGLALPLDSFSISVREPHISVAQSVDGRNYQFKEYYINEQYCCAVCAADAGENAFEEGIRYIEIRHILMS